MYVVIIQSTNKKKHGQFDLQSIKDVIGTFMYKIESIKFTCILIHSVIFIPFKLN